MTLAMAYSALSAGCTHSKTDATEAPTRLPAALHALPKTLEACGASQGIRWAGKQRFWAGVNYAWSRGDKGFGADFGGIAAMKQPGVAAIESQVTADFRALHDQGASFVRWFVFPTLDSDGIGWSHDNHSSSGGDIPTGLNDATLRDLDAAMQAADSANVYLVLTIFSFDAFRETHRTGAVISRSLQPLIQSSVGLAAVERGIVEPLVARVSTHRLHERVAAWDIINEPEWATASLGCEAMQTDDRKAKRNPVQCTPVASMHHFIATTAETIRKGSSGPRALITVGSSSTRDAHHWATPAVAQDFYQVHRYPHQAGPSPTEASPLVLGLADRPVLLGEFPGAGLDDLDTLTTLRRVRANGYAGALLWSFSDRKLGWDTAGLQTFATTNGCQSPTPSQ